MRGVILVAALTLFVRRRTESATDVVVVVMNRFGGKKIGVGEGATVAYYARRESGHAPAPTRRSRNTQPVCRDPFLFFFFRRLMHMRDRGILVLPCSAETRMTDTERWLLDSISVQN